MSRAEEFLNVLQSDPELDAQLRAAATSEEATNIVVDAGFADVSLSDVQAFLAAESDGDELSEHQLAAAAGAGAGGSFWWDPDSGGPPGGVDE